MEQHDDGVILTDIGSHGDDSVSVLVLGAEWVPSQLNSLYLWPVGDGHCQILTMQTGSGIIIDIDYAISF